MADKYEVYAGLPGTGKTYELYREVLEEASKHPVTRYIFISPEQSGSTTERTLIETNMKTFGRPGFFNVDVVGFSRLAYNVFKSAGIKSSDILEDYEKTMLIRSICSDLEGRLGYYKTSIDKPGFIAEVSQIISEFVKYNISPDEIADISGKLEESILKKKLPDIQLIYAAYMEYMDTHKLGLSEERPRKLAGILADDSISIPEVDGAVIVLDGFRGFVTDQLDIIRHLYRRASRLIISVTIDADIVRSGAQVEKHELFYQSYITLRDVQEALGKAPELRLFDKVYGDDELSHIVRHAFRYPVAEYKGQETAAAEFWEADSERDELTLVAQDIRRRVKAGARYRDFAIITGNLESVSRYSDAIFRAYDIPVFMDMTRKLEKNLYTDAILRLLDMVDSDFSYESVFGFLKSGIYMYMADGKSSGDTSMGRAQISQNDIEKLENYVLRRGIRGFRLWSTPFTTGIKDEHRLKEAEQCDVLRAWLMSLVKPLTALGKRVTVARYIAAIKEITDGPYLRYEYSIERSADKLERLGRSTDERFLRSLYAELHLLLDNTGSFMGSMEMTVHDFAEMLTVGMQDIDVGIIPPVLDSVLMGDIVRTRIGYAKTVYFINVNNGIVPSKHTSGRILSDKDRARVSELLEKKSLAPDSVQKGYDELFRIYQVLSKPVERLVMSCSYVAADGSGTTASYIYNRVQRLFPGRNRISPAHEHFLGSPDADVYDVTEILRRITKGDAVSAEDRDFVRQYVGYTGNVRQLKYISDALDYSNSPGVVEQSVLEHANLKISVSKLQTFAKCPYAYYLTYVLGLRARETDEQDSLWLGNVMHRAMELSVSEVRNKYNNDWNGISDDTLKTMMEGYLLQAWNEVSEETGIVIADKSELTGRQRYLYDTMSQMGEKVICNTAYQLRAGSIYPEATEQAFTASFDAKWPDGSPFTVVINGKIDRIDIGEYDGKSYVRIIDYKTGKDTFSPFDIEDSQKIQLPVYMDIILRILREMDRPVLPAGMYYYHVDNPVVDIKTAELSDVTEAAAEELLRQAFIMSGPTEEESRTMQDRKLTSGTSSSDVVEVKVKERGGYSASTILIPAADMENMSKAASLKMVEEASEILKGLYPKEPVKTGQNTNCKFCDFKSVCRFNVTSGYIRVKKSQSGNMDKVRELCDSVGSDDVKYRNLKFIDVAAADIDEEDGGDGDDME